MEWDQKKMNREMIIRAEIRAYNEYDARAHEGYYP